MCDWILELCYEPRDPTISVLVTKSVPDSRLLLGVMRTMGVARLGCRHAE
jgi:hypothetical protein